MTYAPHDKAPAGYRIQGGRKDHALGISRFSSHGTAESRSHAVQPEAPAKGYVCECVLEED